MAATTGGAMKARLEALGLGISAYRQGAPEDAPYPHIVVHEGIGIVPLPELGGDYGDPDAEVMVREECQVDLYQRSRVATTTPGRTRSAEDTTLMDRVAQGLRGAKLGAIGSSTTPATVSGVGTRRRWPVKDNVLRDTLAVFVDRPQQRSPLP